jgi:UDP-N-acetylglucosamine-lysosomal-enzyme
MHAPYIRKVFIVTNGQVPIFLNLNNTRLEVVSHEAIFRDKTDLPVFNSNAIEVHLHRIPNISRYFIYMNDDFLFNSDSKIEDFFDFEKQEYKLYLDSTHFMNGTFKTDFNGNKSVD